MGLFDAEEFMNEMQEAEEISTQRLTFDAGVYPGVISKVEVKSGEKEGRAWAQFQAMFEIDDDGVKEAVKRDVVRVPYSFFLDLDEDTGKLDKSEGRNTDLGRLLKAVGLNGKAWSPQSLVGQRCLVHVKKVPIKDSTEGDTRAEVKGVAAGV